MQCIPWTFGLSPIVLQCISYACLIRSYTSTVIAMNQLPSSPRTTASPSRTPATSRVRLQHFPFGGQEAAGTSRSSTYDAAHATNFFMTSPIVVGKPLAVAKRPSKPSKRSIRRWTPEEDEQLIRFVQHTIGWDGNDPAPPAKAFAPIGSQLQRTAKQCRERYKNFLRDGIQKGNWTTQEEDLIRDLYQTFGSRWSAMAKLLKNRTDNDIKNKWHAMRNKERRMGRVGSYNEMVDSNTSSHNDNHRAMDDTKDDDTKLPARKPPPPGSIQLEDDHNNNESGDDGLL